MALDRLTSMAVFVKCVETGSLTGAGRAFGLSQTMVSKHVRALEQALGVRLLDVNTRRLNLTEAGRRYLARCVQILGEVDDAAQDASHFQRAPTGLLRLAAPEMFGRLHLAPAIADFMEQYDGVAIDGHFADRFVDLVEEGFDLAVRIGSFPDSSLVVRRLGVCRMLTCAAPAYLERVGTPEHPADLADHSCLCLSTVTTPGVWPFRGVDGEDMAVAVSGRLRANSIELLATAAERGLGIIYGPSFVLGERVEVGRLRSILEPFEPPPLDIGAVMPSRRLIPMKVRGFVDFLAQRFGTTLG